MWRHVKLIILIINVYLYCNVPITYATQVFHNVITREVEPRPHFTEELEDVVSKLLTKQPGMRLGCLKGGANDIMKHPWFESIDWGKLVKRQLKAEVFTNFIPKQSNPLDVSAFDTYPEEDEQDWSAYLDPVKDRVFAKF